MQRFLLVSLTCLASAVMAFAADPEITVTPGAPSQGTNPNVYTITFSGTFKMAGTTKIKRITYEIQKKGPNGWPAQTPENGKGILLATGPNVTIVENSNPEEGTWTKDRDFTAGEYRIKALLYRVRQPGEDVLESAGKFVKSTGWVEFAIPAAEAPEW